MPKHNIPPLTEADEARIQEQIASDPDAPEATDEELASMRPFAVVFPELAASMKRGRPKLESPKRAISLRLDADVLDAWRATGPGWQGRVNEALRKAMP